MEPAPPVVARTMLRTARRCVVAGVALLVPAVAPAVPAPAPQDDGLREAIRAVHAAAGERDPGPLADAAWELRRYDGRTAARLLVAVATARDTHDIVIDACADALARHRSEESAAAVVAAHDKARGDRRILTLELLGRLDHPLTETALLLAVEDESPRLRTAAVRALADRREPTTGLRVAAERAARDADPRVRSAAIAALASWKRTPGALPLLHRLVREDGRLFGDAWDGLRRIAGKDLPPRPDPWADWWRTQPDEEDFHFGVVPGPRPEVAVRLPGLVSWSRRVVFVLDLSEGMGDEPGYRWEEIVPGDVRRDGGPALERWKAVKTRLDHARLHLERAIEGLPPEASFEVVFGAESANGVFRELEPATEANKQRAIGRLRGLAADNRSDVMELLEAAMAWPAGDPADDEAFTAGADTVVYIGTALPSIGDETEPGRILARVRRWNRVRQVVFLGLGVGTHDAGFLSNLASLLPRGHAASIP